MLIGPLSLRTRLVVGLASLATIGLVVADLVTYTSLRSFLFDRTDSALEAEHHVIEDALLRGHYNDFRTVSAIARGDYIEIRNAEGTVVFANQIREFPQDEPREPPRLPKKVSFPSTPRGPELVRFLTVGSADGRWRVRADVDRGSSYTLFVAKSLQSTDSTLDRLLLIELLVSAGVIAAILVLGLWIVGLGLRPLKAIGRTADSIREGDLSQRVKPADERTEVGRLGLALNAMLGRIEASDLRLRRFIADASHELRTPLSAVRAYAELFDRGAEQRPDDLRRAMNGIGRESKRMSELVEDLLLLARLDEKRPLEREPVQLDELAAEAVETARAVDTTGALSITAEPVAVLGDRERLRQALDNLLANVRAHTPPETPARVTVSTADGQAFLEVSDDGPGMAAEDAARVFERFYRADESRARTSGGVGLGLAIVQAVVEAHDGRVSVESRPGDGTTFRISLPLA